MTPEGISRHLIAILSADVKDYTRLMSQDDVGTIRTLTAYKEAMETLIRRYRGQVVDATGDSFLARFDSVLDAVNVRPRCSGTWQSEMPSCPMTAGWSSAWGSASGMWWRKRAGSTETG